MQIVPGQVSPPENSSPSSLRCWVVHTIPGRMRFRMESRRLFADLAAAFETFLRDLPGIQDVRLNPTCRSVTLTYDPNLSRVETFLARVQALSLNQFSTSPARSLPDRTTEDFTSLPWLPLGLSSAAVALALPGLLGPLGSTLLNKGSAVLAVLNALQSMPETLRLFRPTFFLSSFKCKPL